MLHFHVNITSFIFGIMTNTNEWHNTGSNGRASEVWCRTVNGVSVEIRVMPYRCMVDAWENGKQIIEGSAFPTLRDAKDAMNYFLNYFLTHSEGND